MTLDANLDEKDESDLLAAEKVAKRRLDFMDYCGIIFAIGFAIYGYLKSDSFETALKYAFLVYAVFMGLKLINRAEKVYRGYLALQYRSKLINERLTEIESHLNSRIDALERKVTIGK